MTNLKNAIIQTLTLFGSLGTLLCCALPAVLVSAGAGAVVASVVAAVPQLVWLSEHKIPLRYRRGSARDRWPDYLPESESAVSDRSDPGEIVPPCSGFDRGRIHHFARALRDRLLFRVRGSAVMKKKTQGGSELTSTLRPES